MQTQSKGRLAAKQGEEGKERGRRRDSLMCRWNMEDAEKRKRGKRKWEK